MQSANEAADIRGRTFAATIVDIALTDLASRFL
jgi:hypothetical protein